VRRRPIRHRHVPSGVADAERVFKAFSEGGRIDMPLDKTFFAKGFGMLTDRFDIPWMIITEERP
jgi:PhnB protein